MDSGFFMVPTAQWGFASSPIIHDGKVLVLCDVQKDSFLAAFDLAVAAALADAGSTAAGVVRFDRAGVVASVSRRGVEIVARLRSQQRSVAAHSDAERGLGAAGPSALDGAVRAAPDAAADPLIVARFAGHQDAVAADHSAGGPGADEAGLLRTLNLPDGKVVSACPQNC